MFICKKHFPIFWLIYSEEFWQHNREPPLHWWWRIQWEVPWCLQLLTTCPQTLLLCPWWFGQMLGCQSRSSHTLAYFSIWSLLNKSTRLFTLIFTCKPLSPEGNWNHFMYLSYSWNFSVTNFSNFSFGSDFVKLEIISPEHGGLHLESWPCFIFILLTHFICFREHKGSCKLSVLQTKEY